VDYLRGPQGKRHHGPLDSRQGRASSVTRNIELLTEVPPMPPPEAILPPAELSAEEAAALDFLRSDGGCAGGGVGLTEGSQFE